MKDNFLGLDNIRLTATEEINQRNNVPGIDPETNQYGVGNDLDYYFTILIQLYYSSSL